MKHLHKIAASATVALFGCGLATSSAQAITLNLIEGSDNAVNELTSALIAPGSGVNIVSGSEVFVGTVGNGIDPNTAQSATYTNFNLVPNNVGLPNITNPNGILLTSGTANVPFTNTNTSFDPFIPGTGGDTDLSTILTNAGLSSVVEDVNSFSFNFTVDPGFNAIESQIVFGSDEFPDQAVTDIFAFIVDGVNYAKFQNGSLVSFQNPGQPNPNFNQNDVGSNNYNLEYDGISNSLRIVGLLDPNLTTHTLKIAIADTDDDIFDSGVFIGGLAGTQATGGGINPGGGGTTVPEPTSILGLMMFGAFGVGSQLKRKQQRK